MKLCSIVGALTWIAIATATLESDSRGNWSNEKEPSCEQRRVENRTKEIVDDSPRDRIPDPRSESIEHVEAKNDQFPEKNVEENREATKRLANQPVQPNSLPSLTTSVTEQARNETSKNVSRSTRTSESDTSETVVTALQYAPTPTPNHPARDSDSNDLGYLNSDEQLDLESGADFGQRVRSSSASRSRSNENVGRARFRTMDARPFPDNYRKQRRKSSRPFAITKLNVSDLSPKEGQEFHGIPNRNDPEEEYNGSVLSNKLKLSGSFWTNDEEESDGDTGKDQAAASLGKFTGPIVVADLPRRKKYSFARTEYAIDDNDNDNDDDDDDDESPKAESVYPTASSAVLNPLQVGVALMNAGQNLNSVNEPIASVNEYLRDEPDSSDSANSSILIDRQQESVASDGPAQSVEIQKSVEVFHTAPVHEIHYPIEFVPYAQQANSKQRPQQRGGQRLGQINVYKSNEIPDDNISSNRERARYEYDANMDDDNSATNARDTRVTDVKPAVDVRDDSEYNRTAGMYSNVERIPDDTVVGTEAVAERNEFEAPRVIAKFGTAVPVGIESLPAPENVENPREAQVTAQTSLTELSFPITVPRHYPAETPRVINADEKKLPNQLEKVIEKQITIPQPFPVHVPVDRVVEKQIRIPYPVQVEKVIEKKVPFAIQRLIVPIPIHFRIPQPVPIPIEKVVEKSVPVPIPIPVEKVIEKTVHHPRPRPLDAENVRPYLSENPKAVKSFKQIPRPYENNNYFNSTATAATTVVPAATASTQFHGSGYFPVNRPFARQQPTLHALPNNKFAAYGIRYPHSVVYTASNDNNANFVFYGRTFPEKDQILDEYVGPVPRKMQLSLGIQPKSALQYASPDVQSTMRRTRQEGNTGSFRQSKMEYGFKPPMVPSIQYDEQTATKVD